MDIYALNWLAVLVAAVSAFVLGGLWYGPLFGRAWQANVGLTDDAIAAADKGKTFGGAFLLTLVAAFGLAMLLQLHPAPGLVPGLSAGALVGVAFAATTTGINYLFAQKTMALFAVDAGYMVAMLAVMGGVIGGWL
jgi:hypothetical protein